MECSTVLLSMERKKEEVSTDSGAQEIDISVNSKMIELKALERKSSLMEVNMKVTSQAASLKGMVLTDTNQEKSILVNSKEVNSKAKEK